MRITNQQRFKLTRIFRNQAVATAYLFGSVSRRQNNSSSDLDIAIFFQPEIKINHYFQKQLKLYQECSIVFPQEKLDLLVLNLAPPAIRYNAVIKGICLYSQPSFSRHNFEFQVMREFEDNQHFYQQTFQNLKKHLRQQTFGRPIIKNTYVSS